MPRKTNATPAPDRIAQEMAELSRERGTGLTESDLRAEGFSIEEIQANAPKAAEILRAMDTRIAA